MNRQQRRAQGKTSINTPSQQDQIWWNQGLAHHQRGELMQATTCYQRIALSSPLHHQALGNLGVIAMQQKRWSDALILLQKALSIQPDFVDALINQGIVLKELHQLEAAEACYRQILTIAPRDIRAYGNLGVILKNLGRLDEAESCFLQVLALQPNHIESLNNLGNLHRDSGRWNQAEQCYLQALAMRPDHVDILFNLGMIYQQSSRLEEARRIFLHALTRQPDHIELLYNLGITCKELGRFDEARQHYQNVLNAKPDYAEAHNNLGNVLQELHQFTQAEASYGRALALKPDYALAYKQLGDLLRKLGRVDEAIINYRHALSADPQDALGAGFALAALGCEPLPSRASPDQLDLIYAKRASYWDRISSTSYRGAELVAQTLRLQLPATPKPDILDAGCGTGLVGVLIRDLANRLDGIDLSSDMLEKAREKGIYDHLHQGDLESFMLDHPGQYDAIGSAATLIHFGDLSSVFQAAAQTLRTGGLFVSTLFANEADWEGDAVVINPLEGFERGGCYAHGKGHVLQKAEQAGFEPLAVQREIHEYVNEIPVHCLVVVLRLKTDS